MTARFEILPDPDAVAEAAADRFVAAAEAAIRARGVFRAALSGGATPRRVYPRILEAPRVDAADWSHTELFFGDERTVPPEHPDSNFACARPLIQNLPGLRPECVHRMPADEEDLQAAAAAYETELAHSYGLVSPAEADGGGAGTAAPGEVSLGVQVTHLPCPVTGPRRPSRQVGGRAEKERRREPDERDHRAEAQALSTNQVVSRASTLSAGRSPVRW